MEFKRKHCVRSTKAQIKYIIEFMSRNNDFRERTGVYTLGSPQAEAKWNKLARELAQYGPAKSKERWKLTWRDLKVNAQKAKQIEKEGGPAIPPQSLKVLEIIGAESRSRNSSLDQSSGSECDPTVYNRDTEHNYSSKTDMITDDMGYSNSIDLVLVEDTSECPSPVAHEERVPKRYSSEVKSNIKLTPKKKRKTLFSHLLATQRNTNKLLEDLRHEINLSNQLRLQQVDVLKKIAKNLEQM